MPLTPAQMDDLMDRHFAFEMNDDVDGVLGTLADGACHDIVGAPDGPTVGRERTRETYERLFSDLAGDRVETLHRSYGRNTLTDESLWIGRATGRPLGYEGADRPLRFRILHVMSFDDDGLILRENVWLDYPNITAQLAPVAADTEPQQEGTPTMTTTEPTTTGTPPEVMDEVMARHFEAEANHDRPGILATLTEDAEHEPVGFPGAPFHSHDELMGFYEVLFEQLEQLDIEPVRRLYGHNFLVDEIQYKGRAYNDFMGFEFGPDGKPVDFRLMHICEFEGDRMSREQVWLDVNAIRFQSMA